MNDYDTEQVRALERALLDTDGSNDTDGSYLLDSLLAPRLRTRSGARGRLALLESHHAP